MTANRSMRPPSGRPWMLRRPGRTTSTAQFDQAHIKLAEARIADRDRASIWQPFSGLHRARV
jgi:hypothetical protein